MLKWAIIFAIVALIAGALGFTGVAGAAAAIAKILFFIFLVVFVVFLVLGLTAARKIAGEVSTPSLPPAGRESKGGGVSG